MLNRLSAFVNEYKMIAPGDRVICAVSGGADSMALLWAMYLLRQKLDFSLEAAHYNHHLRGSDSDRDEAFVRDFCARYEIPLHLGQGQVQKGDKGLEAAARAARYGFFRSLSGKIATAHTANDNAETVLLNMVRGTGLKGLGAITPVGENLIRPMLTVTRQQVLAFLQEYHISHVSDSSNDTDAFLRNRLRHHVMPLLEAENPRIAENLSAMALRLRQDQQALDAMLDRDPFSVSALRQLPPALRSRALEQLLKESGVKEPTGRHLALAEDLVFSQNPSAQAAFPGGVRLARCYDELQPLPPQPSLEPRGIPCPSITELPELGLRLICRPAQEILNTQSTFTVTSQGPVQLRPRQTGDQIRTSGGTKSLKKLFVDRKIPASQRDRIPVLSDDGGLLGVYGLGVNHARKASELPAVQFLFEKI